MPDLEIFCRGRPLSAFMGHRLSPWKRGMDRMACHLEVDKVTNVLCIETLLPTWELFDTA